MKSVFVTPEVFDWASELSSWGSFPRQKQRRDYEILAHASTLLDGEDSIDRRGDCVNALNRVIDKRVRLLNDHYQIDEILGSKKSIDNLEKIGAARRYMLLQINRIRNFFEHRDRKPPPRTQLKLFVELTWYFVKATDIPAYVPRTEIQLNRSGMLDQGEDYLVIRYSRKSRSPFPWDIKISLMFGLFSHTPIDGWPEFTFPDKEARILPEYKNKLWAFGGRQVPRSMKRPNKALEPTPYAGRGSPLTLDHFYHSHLWASLHYSKNSKRLSSPPQRDRRLDNERLKTP